MKKNDIAYLINYNILDTPVYINNSIFNDLLKTKELAHISQRSYAFGYYCLITYLYKNAKYQYNIIKQCELKAILGYSPDNRKMDFISKKDGVLEQIGYTETITDFPVKIDTEKCSVFGMYKSVKEELKLDIEVSSNYKVKFPVRAFHNNMASWKLGRFDGSFYDATNCHLFNIEKFLNCVSNEEIGCVGFFVAAYIQAKGILLRTGPFSNIVSLSNELCIDSTTMLKYAYLFSKYNIIPVDFRHNQDVREVSLYLRHQLAEWREGCLRKYNCRCIITGSKENLEVHHLHDPFALIRDKIFEQSGISYKPFKEYAEVELAFLSYKIIKYHKSVEGVPLRQDIHYLLHKKYGNFPSVDDLLDLKANHLIFSTNI